MKFAKGLASVFLILPVRTKDRRNAAFELASLAASGEEHKYKILKEDGYATLIDRINSNVHL